MRPFSIDEPDGRRSTLLLPDQPELVILHAAVGIAAAAPSSDGRARALLVLAGGGLAAVSLAVDVVAAAMARPAEPPAPRAGESADAHDLDANDLCRRCHLFLAEAGPVCRGETSEPPRIARPGGAP